MRLIDYLLLAVVAVCAVMTPEEPIFSLSNVIAFAFPYRLHSLYDKIGVARGSGVCQVYDRNFRTFYGIFAKKCVCANQKSRSGIAAPGCPVLGLWG